VIRLAREEGLLVGISTGANVVGALKVAEEIRRGNIVTIACDSAFRYIDDIISYLSDKESEDLRLNE